MKTDICSGLARFTKQPSEQFTVDLVTEDFPFAQPPDRNVNPITTLEIVGFRDVDDLDPKIELGLEALHNPKCTLAKTTAGPGKE